MIGAVLAGAASVVGADIFRGFFQKDKVASSPTITHAPYEQYAPVKTFAPQITQVYQPQYQYAVQIESPAAAISATKEDIADVLQKQKITPSVDIAAPTAIGTTAGTDLTKIAIIGAVALIAYGAVTK